jgi:hypothetical protein
MKKIKRACMFASLLCLAVVNAFSQAEASVSNEIKLSKNTETPVAATTQGKEVVINFKNGAEKPVAIFAGPKEEIREPKLNTYGGMSSGKLYVKENEVVCLMTTDKKPIACALIKPGITSVEVNSSANAITGK